MITEACFEGLPQVFGCVWAEVFGSAMIGGLVALILLAFIMYKFGLNMAVSIPLSFLAVFSLYYMIFADLFQNIMLIIMVFGAAILGFALVRYFKR